MCAPLLVDYTLHGKIQNGHIVMRYPKSTEVIGKSAKGTYAVTLIGSNDCNPEYKLVTIPGGRFGATQRSKLSPEDKEEWNQALAIK